MFPRKYFPANTFAPRFFPQSQGEAPDIGGKVCSTLTITARVTGTLVTQPRVSGTLSKPSC